MKEDAEDRVLKCLMIGVAVATVFAVLMSVLAVIHLNSLIDQCMADGQPRWMCEGLLQ